MEKRANVRMELNSFCRVAPPGNRRKGGWKRIENISGAGMLVEWCRDGQTHSPRVGETFQVEIDLPAHPVFGQRALQFRAKVIRVSRGEDDRILAALETQNCRFQPKSRSKLPEASTATYVN
jgi:hypothetical protein